MKRILLVAMSVFFVIAATAIGQERGGKVALMIMRDPFDPPLDLGMTFWINNKVTLEPVLGFSYIKPEAGDGGTNFRLGVGGKLHFGERDVTPYIGSRLAYNLLSGGGESYSDFVFGTIFGAEYFLSDWFSAGWEFQLNYSVADKEYSPSGLQPGAKTLNTGQLMALRLYFK